MEKTKEKLSIVIPLANESNTLNDFYEEIIDAIKPYSSRLDINILFVLDNVSKDNTKKIVEELEKKDKRVKLLWAPQNRCVVDAYVNGFLAAFDMDVDYILEMDGGFSHQPKEIPQFIHKLLEGYDCVFGSRFIKGGGLRSTPKRKFFSKIGTIIANIFLGLKLKDATSGFEGFRVDVLKKILKKSLKSRGHFFQTEIRFRARTFKWIEVPIHYKNPSNSLSSEFIKNSVTTLFSCIFARIREVRYD